MKSFKTFISEGVNDPAIFKAVFLAGGPGAGKSFVVGKTALTAIGFRLINSDVAFETAMKKIGMATTPENIYTEKGQSIRDSAKSTTKSRQKMAIRGRLGLIIDGTGKDFEKIAQQKHLLETFGYECMMIFVNTDLDTASVRNANRDRSLPDSKVKNMWAAVQKSIGKFQNLFGGKMIIVDNSAGANIEGGTLATYKKVLVWSKSPIRNPLAQRWIKSQNQK